MNGLHEKTGGRSALLRLSSAGNFFPVPQEIYFGSNSGSASPGGCGGGMPLCDPFDANPDFKGCSSLEVSDKSRTTSKPILGRHSAGT
jgi:hypothetical protein